MATREKTVEIPFVTNTATLATNTTLGTATVHTFAAVTLALPESGKTMRSVVLRVHARGGEPTTARRFDGVRIGVQIDAVAFNDVDLTGTGITNTGDHWSVFADRDVTSYFVTNYTGTSHTVGARVAFETDVADVVANISCYLIVTYSYDDTSATHAKTVRIGMEGITGFLPTTANSDLRGSAGSGQIPLLDNFLPEASKTIDHIWFEVRATDGGAATTDFNCNYSIDAGATATRATLEQGLNTSVRFFDIWVQTGVMTTSSAHDFEAWSSLASRFQRMNAVLCVTYRFTISGTSTVLNSLRIPLRTLPMPINSTAAGDQDVFERVVWIQEPTTITLVQSSLLCFYEANGAGNLTISVSGHDAAGGSQGTTSATYTNTAFVQSGSHCLQHRLDLAHGGTAITLGRGKNTIRVKVFCATANAVHGFGGYLLLNYTSGVATDGVGAHNQTTDWQLATILDGTIAGTATREVDTTNQRTPIITPAEYFLTANSVQVETNSSATGGFGVFDEQLAGEGPEDGWNLYDNVLSVKDGEFGNDTFIFASADTWIRYPNAPASAAGILNIETARKVRIYGNTLQQSSIRRCVTLHSIFTNVTGNITNSAGGTVNIILSDKLTGEVLRVTTRTGNGSYSIPWYDNTREVIVTAYETDTLKGASKQDVAGTGFDIDLNPTGGGSGEYGYSYVS